MLVIDDDARTRRLIQSYFEACGISVTAVANGRAAFTLLAESAPALVCLDLSLPDVSGYDVCRFIRSNPALHLVPVLVMSSRSLAVDRACAEEAGASAFLKKPFSLAHLSSEVVALLDGGKS